MAIQVDLHRASIVEKPLIERLLQLYLYDFSEMDGAEIPDSGVYTYRHLDAYWQDPDRDPWLIRVGGRLAGFVLVRRDSVPQRNWQGYSIAEFFVMRRYRRSGVGTAAAVQIFKSYPGAWCVTQMEYNPSGQDFWRKVIAKYTGGDYVETHHADEWHHGFAQWFQSRAVVSDH